jgi:hypothetical protein
VPYTTYGFRLCAVSEAGPSLPSLMTYIATKGQVPTSCGSVFQVANLNTAARPHKSRPHQ